MELRIGNHDCTIQWDGVYYFALSDYPNISAWELKKLLAFLDYEKRHGRKTEIKCEDRNISCAVNDAIACPESVEDARLPAKITECTACKHRGCLTEFVCHTASLAHAKKILLCGKLLSAVKAYEKSAAELVLNKRNAAGDPADYFDYIMFAWGNCVAGDSLVTERNFLKIFGRLPTQTELDEENSRSLITGVRFYFKHEDIIRHPRYIFDGYHPAKIKDELALPDNLYACIVPEEYKYEIEHLVQPDIMTKVFYLPQNGLGIWDWSEKTYEFVKEVNGHV